MNGELVLMGQLHLIITVVGAMCGLLGGVTGLASLLRKSVVTRRKYLRIKLKSYLLSRETAALRMSVHNTGTANRRIDYAMLLICPVGQSPVDAFNRLAPTIRVEKISTTNALYDRRLTGPYYDLSGYAAMPVPYFYKELAFVEDENTSFTMLLDAAELPQGIPLEARFYIFCEGWLHRCTQTLVVLPKRS